MAPSLRKETLQQCSFFPTQRNTVRTRTHPRPCLRTCCAFKVALPARLLTSWGLLDYVVHASRKNRPKCGAFAPYQLLLTGSFMEEAFVERRRVRLRRIVWGRAPNAPGPSRVDPPIE